MDIHEKMIEFFSGSMTDAESKEFDEAMASGIPIPMTAKVRDLLMTRSFRGGAAASMEYAENSAAMLARRFKDSAPVEEALLAYAAGKRDLTREDAKAMAVKLGVPTEYRGIDPADIGPITVAGVVAAELAEEGVPRACTNCKGRGWVNEPHPDGQGVSTVDCPKCKRVESGERFPRATPNEDGWTIDSAFLLRLKRIDHEFMPDMEGIEAVLLALERCSSGENKNG